MKKLLTILFLIISITSFAQTIKVRGDGSIFDSTQVNSKLSEKLNITKGAVTVTDIPLLQAYSVAATTIIVQDSLRGGTFNYVASATPDSGTVFSRSGGGYWQRDYKGAMNSKWFGGLNAAIIGIGSKSVTLDISQTETITTGTIVPSNISLNILKGGSINNAGHDIRIDGSLKAGRYQIFTGTGGVSFGNGSIDAQFPEWDGGKNDGTNSSANTAAFAIQYKRDLPISLGIGTYLFDSIKTTGYSPLIIIGQTQFKSVLQTTATSAIAINIASGYDVYRSTLKNFTLLGTSSNKGGISLGDSTHLAAFTTFDNVEIDSFKLTGAYGISLNSVQELSVNNCTINYNYNNVYRPNYGFLTTTNFGGNKSRVGSAINRGFDIEGEVTDLWIKDITIESNYAEGFYFNSTGGGSSLHLSDLHIEANCTIGLGAIAVISGPRPGMAQFELSNSVCYNNSTSTIPMLYLDSISASISNNFGLIHSGGIYTSSGVTANFENNYSNYGDYYSLYKSLAGNITANDAFTTGQRFMILPDTVSIKNFNITKDVPTLTQNIIRPGGGGYAASFNHGNSGLSTSALTSIYDYGVLGTLPSTISYSYFGVGSDAAYDVNNLRLYPDKTVALMTVNNAVGDFVTRNSSNGKITRRTAAEVVTDLSLYTKSQTDSARNKSRDSVTTSVAATYLQKSDSTIANRVTANSTAIVGKADTSRITQTADYVIEKVGSTIYARPGYKTGLPAYSGSDAYTVIQAAITALTPSGAVGTGGGYILIGKGSFTLSNELTIVGWESGNPRSELVISGVGQATRLIQTTSGKNAIVVKNNTAVSIKNFSISAYGGAKSAILFDDSGTSEISVFKAIIENVFIDNNSATYPAVYLKNFFNLSVNHLVANNPDGNAILLENTTSNGTNYGNSHFSFVTANANSSSPYAGLRIKSNTAYNPINFITFDNYECMQSYYGIDIIGANNNTFNFVDIENAQIPINLGGNSTVQTYNNVFSSGYLLANTIGPAIQTNDYTSSNSMKLFIDGSTSLVPINEGSGWSYPANDYDVTLAYGVNPANNVLNGNTATMKLAIHNNTDGTIKTTLPTNTTISGYSTTGTAAPTTTPTKIGNEYLDLTNKKLYKAFGTSSSADWVIQN